MRTLLRFLAGSFLAAVLLGVVWIGWVRSGPSALEAEVGLPGLEAPVEVLRDSLGVPHVRAESERDLFRVQGFLHARDRLWQMELFRRVATGRLSEIFGEPTLRTDRFFRTLGLGRAAAASREELDPETLALLEAYVQGVNSAIEGWTGPLPPEFEVLRVRPGPWTVSQTLAVEKVMAWDLTAYEESLNLADARRRLGEEGFHHLRPRYPDWGPTILGDRGEGGGDAGEPTRGEEGPDSLLPGPFPSAEVVAAARPPRGAREFMDLIRGSRASNSWVLAGDRSRSGRPLLAGDMHLSLRSPTLWYLVGLHAPGLRAAGMSLPGSPGVVVGHTDAVAWAFTNAYVDDADLLLERVDGADATRYRVPGGSEPFRVRQEVIRVRGGAPDTLEVRETRHGPVMTSVEPRAGGDLLSLRWVGHRPSTTARALLGMNRAGSGGEFLESLADFSNPHQNVLYADTAGAIGYHLAGRIPLRRSGRPLLLPAPGWTGEHDWTSFLSFEDHPRLRDPDRGYMVSANHRQGQDSISSLVSDGRWARPYRARRIEDLLLERELHDGETMRRLQLDVESAFATRYLQDGVDAFRAAGEGEAADILASWDGRSTLESRGATLFYLWMEGLREVARSRLYGGVGGYLPLRVVEEALDGGGMELGGGAEEAAADAASSWEGRPWGEVHRLHLEHPLREVPLLGRFFGFGMEPLPREGAHHTVNVASFPGGPPPFRVTSGPSQRHVVDLQELAEGEGGRFILPGGQSGLPRHRHARDQMERWREGRLWRLPMDRGRIESRAVSRLLLVPPEIS